MGSKWRWREGKNGKVDNDTATAASYIITETDTSTEHKTGTRQEEIRRPHGQGDQGIGH